MNTRLFPVTFDFLVAAAVTGSGDSFSFGGSSRGRIYGGRR